MKHLFSIAAVLTLATGLATGCALAKGGDESLVSPSEPHGIISTGLPPGPSYYSVKIVWLDGNYLSTTRNRDSFWVAPGTHEIGFRAIINPNRGPSVISSPATSGAQDLHTLKVDVKQGYSYYFAAQVPQSGLANQWQPVLIKTDNNNH